MPHHHHHHSHHHHSHHHHSHHSDNAAHGSSRLTGHKRERERDGGFSDSSDGSYVKLFVGSVPRTITEDQVRPMFEEYGEVLEVAILRDKRTGLQQGCCFVKYSSRDEADRAIRYLNNQRALPGGNAPVQVRYADGERERLGAIEHKLFVGCLNKSASEKQVEDIFSRFGRVDDVYIMRDEHKQSRGCAFIKFPSRDIANRAIAALNNVYVMEGCDQPLAVRFADPKRPKTGESRASFSPRHGSGSNRSSGASQHSGRSGSPISWRQTNAPSLRGFSQGGGSPYPPPALPRVSQPAASPASVHGQLSGIPQSPYSVHTQLVPAVSPVIPAQQDAFQPPAQRPTQPFTPGPVQQYVQLPQQPLPYPLQQSVSAVHLQAAQQQFNPPPSQQSFPPVQLSTQQLPSLQQSLTPTLQPNQPLHLQNSPQQQLPHILQPTTASHQQPAWLLSGVAPPAATPIQLLQSLAGPPVIPPAAPTTTCNWTEHVSPEGHKYYYNSVTLESKWEKPEELLKFEQQQQQQQVPLPPPPPVPPIQEINLSQFRGGTLEQLRQQIWL